MNALHFHIRQILLAVSGLTLAGTLSAQNINYKVLSNDPQPAPLSINTDLFQMDFMTRALDATSFNAGVWGHFEPVPNKIGAQFLVRKNWFMLGRLGVKDFPGHLETELGGYLTVTDNMRNRLTKVVLKKEYGGTTYSTNMSGDRVGTRTETTTFVRINSNKRKMSMLRGGLYRKSHGMLLEHYEDKYDVYFEDDLTKFTTMGVYAGIQLRTLTSLFIDTEEYGVQYNSIGSDVFFDVMILPVNTFKDTAGNNVSDMVKTLEKNIPIGFRAGYRLFQIDPEEKTGKMFGMCATAETGWRPYTGFFLTAGIGLTFVK